MGTFAAEVSRELAERGHRVLLLAPSRSSEFVRESRKLIRSARENPQELFDPEGGVRTLGVGELLFNPSRKGINPSPPIDIARTIEEVLGTAQLDFVHVHEPWAPSAGSVALRHSRALECGLVPQSRRAGPQHPGREKVRGAVLRPDGRADGELRGHRRAAEPLLPRLLPPAAPRHHPRGAREDRRAGEDRVLRPRGARRAATVPAGAAAAPGGAAVGGRDLLADGRGADAALEPAQPRERRRRRGGRVPRRGHRGGRLGRAGDGSWRPREGARSRCGAARGARAGLRGGPQRRRPRLPLPARRRRRARRAARARGARRRVARPPGQGGCGGAR